MTTITLENDIKLNKTNFINVDDLLSYLLPLTNSKIEYEDFNDLELDKINSFKGVKLLDEAINSLKI